MKGVELKIINEPSRRQCSQSVQNEVYLKDAIAGQDKQLHLDSLLVVAVVAAVATLVVVVVVALNYKKVGDHSRLKGEIFISHPIFISRAVSLPGRFFLNISDYM